VSIGDVSKMELGKAPDTALYKGNVVTFTSADTYHWTTYIEGVRFGVESTDDTYTYNVDKAKVMIDSGRTCSYAPNHYYQWM